MYVCRADHLAVAFEGGVRSKTRRVGVFHGCGMYKRRRVGGMPLGGSSKPRCVGVFHGCGIYKTRRHAGLLLPGMAPLMFTATYCYEDSAYHYILGFCTTCGPVPDQCIIQPYFLLNIQCGGMIELYLK